MPFNTYNTSTRYSVQSDSPSTTSPLFRTRGEARAYKREAKALGLKPEIYRVETTTQVKHTRIS